MWVALMWNLVSKRNALRDRMMLIAPEANPHEFVRRYLLARSRPELPRPYPLQLDRRQSLRQQDAGLS